MGVLSTFDDYSSQTGGRNRAIFYNLRIDAESGSQKLVFRDDKGKSKHGRYEEGWFLCKLNHAPLISVHIKRSDERQQVAYLCNRTFSDLKNNECPMCVSYQNSSNRKKHPFGANVQFLTLPFLATRRQEEPQVNKGKYEIIPIYWFEMNVTKYCEDTYYQNYLQLDRANQANPLHKSPYRIIKKDKDKDDINRFYFQALKEKDRHAITIEHPMIDDWMDDKGRWLWDDDYMELLQYLAISRYRPYVDPETNEPLEYGGHYQKAVEFLTTYLQEYGSPSKELDNPVYDNDGDDDVLG